MAENEIMRMDERAIAETLKGILTPVLESMAQLIRHNTEAMERLAASQQIQSDRIEALERQVRLNTPVTAAQVRYFNSAIRKRAEDALEKYHLDGDRKAVNRLAAMIRKSILIRCGAGALNEIPKHEYGIIINQISGWNDMLMIRTIVKEARARAETEDICRKPPADMDG